METMNYFSSILVSISRLFNSLEQNKKSIERKAQKKIKFRRFETKNRQSCQL